MPFYQNIKDFLNISTKNCCQKIRTCGMHADKENITSEKLKNPTKMSSVRIKDEKKFDLGKWLTSVKQVCFRKAKPKVNNRRPTGWSIRNLKSEEEDFIATVDSDKTNDDEVHKVIANKNAAVYNVAFNSSGGNFDIFGIKQDQNRNTISHFPTIRSEASKKETNGILRSNWTNKGMMVFPSAILTNSSDDYYKKETIEHKQNDKKTVSNLLSQTVHKTDDYNNRITTNWVKSGDTERSNQRVGNPIKMMWTKKDTQVYHTSILRNANNKYSNGSSKNKKDTKKSMPHLVSIVTTSDEILSDDQTKSKKPKQSEVNYPTDRSIRSNNPSKESDNKADKKPQNYYTIITKKSVESVDYKIKGSVKGENLINDQIVNSNDIKLAGYKQTTKRSRPHSASTMTSDEDSDYEEPIKTKRAKKATEVNSTVEITSSSSKYDNGLIKSKKLHTTKTIENLSDESEEIDNYCQTIWGNEEISVFSASTLPKPEEKLYWIKSNLQYIIILPIDKTKGKKPSTVHLEKSPTPKSLLSQPQDGELNKNDNKFTGEEDKFSGKGEELLMKGEPNEDKKLSTEKQLSGEKKEFESITSSDAERIVKNSTGIAKFNIGEKESSSDIFNSKDNRLRKPRGDNIFGKKKSKDPLLSDSSDSSDFVFR